MDDIQASSVQCRLSLYHPRVFQWGMGTNTDIKSYYKSFLFFLSGRKARVKFSNLVLPYGPLCSWVLCEATTFNYILHFRELRNPL